MEIPVERAMTPMEVEFVLGIVSAVGPLECWMIVGSDLTRFILRNRKRIDEWILRVASLLLARMVLKKYARSLYQKISMALTDGACSNLSETTATDDAFIARFTGRLLGTYKSDAVMDEALTMRWSASLGILKGLETLVSISSGTDASQST